MLGKFIFVLLLISVISQAKCQNQGSSGANDIPQSFLGEILRRTADIRRQIATMVDKAVFSFKGALKNNAGGFFGGFRKIFGNNGNFNVDPEQDREAYDMNVKPEVEVFTNRLFPNQNYNGRFTNQNYNGRFTNQNYNEFSRNLNYNGRPIRGDFIFKLISDLCAEGRPIPGVCNG